MNFIFVASFFFVGIITNSIVDCHKDNYPEHNYFARPCSQRNYTVRYTGLICIPNGTDTFTQESQDQCKAFKEKECPEFNEWVCMWYDLPCDKGGTLKFPVCRLKYKAEGYTWMEILYTNQYGTTNGIYNNTMLSILELHRFIKNNKVFDKDQKDYPNNVPDPKQPQGVKWETLKPEKEAIAMMPSLTKPETLCVDPQDKNCLEVLRRAFVDKFNKYGIGAYHGLNKTNVFGTEQSCVDYVHDGLRRRTCRVGFTDTVENSGVIQVVCEMHAYFDNASKKMEYREAVLGGNSFSAEGDLIR